jgi:hypothetical protein
MLFKRWRWVVSIMSTKICMIDKVTTNQAQTKKNIAHWLTHSWMLLHLPTPKLVWDATSGRHPFVYMVKNSSHIWCVQHWTIHKMKNHIPAGSGTHTHKLVNRKWTCFWKPFMKALMESNVEADNITCNLLYPHLEWKQLVFVYTLHFRVCYMTNVTIFSR